MENNSLSLLSRRTRAVLQEDGCITSTLTTRFDIGNGFIFDSACERVGLLSRCACEASPGAHWSVDGLFAYLPGLKTVLGDTGISKMTIV